MKKAIIYVTGQTLSNEISNKFNDWNFQQLKVNGIKQFFLELNQEEFSADLILFDLDCLCSDSCTDVFDILSTTRTILKVKSSSTAPVIGVAISSQADTSAIKNILTTDIRGFLYDISNADTVEETRSAIEILLDGKNYVNKELLTKIKPQRKYGYYRPTKNVKGIQLTVRQEQILNLICTRGSSNKSIARILNLSESTIKLHIGAILKKYGLRNRTQLALFTRDYFAKN